MLPSLLIGLGIGCLLLFSLHTDWAERAENLYRDAWHRLAGKRHQPQHVALVIVDDATLARHADTPLVFWTPLFAQAIQTLREVGARTIVLDFIFSGSPEAWLAKLGAGGTATAHAHDRAFRQELNRGNVILAAYLIGEGETAEDFILPHPDFLLALPEQDIAHYVGLANLTLDGDSVVRHFRTRLRIGVEAREMKLPELTLAALAATGADASPPNDDRHAIIFAGPPGSVPHLSFQRLLEPDARHDPQVLALRDKIVVVGAGFAGMNDVHPTPYSNVFGASDRLMSGPEIQANIIETLLSGRTLHAPSVLLIVSLIALIASAIAAITLRYALTWGALATLAACFFIVFFAYRAFLADLLLPAAQMQLALLGALTFAGIGKLSHSEREKQRIQAMFGRYVSPAVLQSLTDAGTMPVLGGERREISVLFSDIRNFTTLSESLAPEEVVELLNHYFERVCTILLAEQATIDKFIGDAVMAEFGAPLAQADHADRALRSAVKMIAIAQELSVWVRERFPERSLPRFEIGIGIHSGPAVVGNIGSPERMEYTAIGDTVNTASRLEGLTKTLGCPILVSMATFAALTSPESYHFGARHLLNVKGRQQAVEAVELWPEPTIRQ